MEKILRVNVRSRNVGFEECSDELALMGGRALISKIMLDEVDPVCDPLREKNKLIIAVGLLAGTTVSCANRISIGGKSPLTGGIKESNAGGTTAYKLGRLGIKAIIIEDLPKDNDLRILYIKNGEAELVTANELREKGVYDTAELLKEKYGGKVGLVIIGPAGERIYRAAGIANADIEGVPSRYSGRGGLGAVMGSKGIKAIVIDDSDSKPVEVHDQVSFKKSRDIVTETILCNEQIANSYTKFGTAGLVDLVNSLGALPTNNFSRGSFEKAEKINGKALYELITSRKGEGSPSHSCMPGCLIKCSNIVPDENGKTIVSPLEYETIGLLGSNCGIGNLDIIAKLNYLCNDIGLDTIDIGGAIGVAMEAGIIGFGDGEGAIGLLNEVRKDTYLGKIIGSGASITGKVLGVTRIPVSKDQTLAAYDPRAIKGLGVTYATSPMGGDHTAGQTLRSPVDHRKTEGQVEASKNAQITNTIHDCIGTCFFVGGAIKGNLKLLADLIAYKNGIDCTLEDLKEIAKATILRELKFNQEAGFNESKNRLSEFFYTEENPQSGTVFDVSDEEMKLVHQF